MDLRHDDSLNEGKQAGNDQKMGLCRFFNVCHIFHILISMMSAIKSVNGMDAAKKVEEATSVRVKT